MTNTRIEFLSLFFAVCISVGYVKPPSRILNGTVVSHTPYQVAILNRWGGIMCGGAILDANHILTAAHCLINNDVSYGITYNTRIAFGSNDLLNLDPSNVFRASSMVIHASYNSSDYSHGHDIGMIKLDRNIIFTENQQPIALPTHDTAVGSVLMTTGFGATQWDRVYKHSRAFSRYLQESKETVISQEQCQAMYSDTDIFPGHLCLSPIKAAHPCVGDSGGPLVDSTSVVGIVSFNRQCDPDYPSIYTRVHEYLPWIKTMLTNM